MALAEFSRNIAPLPELTIIEAPNRQTSILDSWLNAAGIKNPDERMQIENRYKSLRELNGLSDFNKMTDQDIFRYTLRDFARDEAIAQFNDYYSLKALEKRQQAILARIEGTI